MKLPRKDVEKLAKATGTELPAKKPHKWLADSNGKPKKTVYAGNQAFDALCEAHGIPKPQSEYYFDDWRDADPKCPLHAGILRCRKCGAWKRAWRFDHVFDGWLALEIQGALFIEGRHTRGAALLDEYEKLNEAVILGFAVLFCTPEQINDGSIFAVIKRALAGREEMP